MLRCTNKVFLSELLKTHNIPSPKTVILQDSKLTDELRELKFPFILKEPDSAFSKGVKKVNNETELKETLKDFFQKSDLVIAQEFIPTDYDWRVGVLDDEPIFVCKYFMARNHWQIMDWTKKVRKEGKTETIAVEDAPPKLIDIALRAAKAVGNGLYGVDVKEINNKFYIIEVNDNPNIDSGIEDKVLKLDLYRKIMATIVKRIKAS
jgi:glutathione synthase/RimK-type ligase-like ATP-grasp enzyme